MNCGQFDLDAIAEKSDAEAIVELSSLKGIGVWDSGNDFALLLAAPDVFSFGEPGNSPGKANGVPSQRN